MQNSELIIEKMMTAAKITTQEELAEILEVSPAAICKFKKNKIPRKRINIFLQKFPNTQRSDIIDEGYGENLRVTADLLLLAAIVEEHKKFLDAKIRKKEIAGKESHIIKDLIDKKYKKTQVFGSYKQQYLKENIDENNIKLLSLGFCMDATSCMSNTNCVVCKSFLTTQDFFPILKYLQGSLVNMKYFCPELTTNIDDLLQEINNKEDE
jgi:hypothetical protein